MKASLTSRLFQPSVALQSTQFVEKMKKSREQELEFLDIVTDVTSDLELGSLLAKVIATGADRSEAIATMLRALEGASVEGVSTTIALTGDAPCDACRGTGAADGRRAACPHLRPPHHGQNRRGPARPRTHGRTAWRAGCETLGRNGRAARHP
jgi:DnaJ-class molecular chaperone